MRAARLAYDYRQTFNRDVVLDMSVTGASATTKVMTRVTRNLRCTRS